MIIFTSGDITEQGDVVATSLGGIFLCLCSFLIFLQG